MEAGLPIPPVHEPFVPRLRFLPPLLYTTHPTLPYSLYALDPYVKRAEQGLTDFLAIGMAGHGMNSWAIHYYLVTERLQLFVQSRWGGAYTNEEQALTILKERFRQLQHLLELATDNSLEAKGVTGLRVVESDMGTMMLLINGTAQAIAKSPLQDALAWLTSR